jgi:predicted RNase H-like HicB family nuclease
MLESINIPNSVTGIGVLAFSGCSNLQSVLLPKSLSTIKATAFAKCLKSTFIIEDNPFFSAKDGIIFNKEQTEIIAYPTACGDVSIPDTITKIKEFAFSNCSELNQVYFSGSIIIYNNAFLKCNKLENIIFSDSTFQIEFEKLEYYFVLIFNEETNFYNGYAPDLTMYAEGSTKDSVVGCLSELLIYYFELAAKHETDIPAPTSIEELKKKWKRYDVLSFPVETYRMLLGIYPFFNCNNLKSITIPKTVTKITPGMFSGNANLKIRCYQDSYAEQYAKENGISVEYITE